MGRIEKDSAAIDEAVEALVQVICAQDGKMRDTVKNVLVTVEFPDGHHVFFEGCNCSGCALRTIDTIAKQLFGAKALHVRISGGDDTPVVH